MGVFFIVAINIINRYNHINHMERKEKMKPYFAISFLIVFMQIYALGAEEGVSPQTEPADDTEQTETTYKTTCDIKPSYTDNDGNTVTCSKFSDNKTVSAGTYILCDDKTWIYCKAKTDDTGKVTGAEITTIPKKTNTPCYKDYVFHNSKCLRCSELTGEKNAITKDEGNATTMNDCILPEKSGSDYISYQDEKGTFTYLGDCMIACTEETEYYCTSV